MQNEIYGKTEKVSREVNNLPKTHSLNICVKKIGYGFFVKGPQNVENSALDLNIFSCNRMVSF